MSGESTGLKLRTTPVHRNDQYSIDSPAAWITESIDENPAETNDKKIDIALKQTTVEISVHQVQTPTTPPEHTFSPTTIITTSSSVDTLNGESSGMHLISGPSSPSNISSVTLVGSTGSGSAPNETDKDASQDNREFKFSQAPTSPLPERKRKPSSENHKTEPRTDTSPRENEEADKSVRKTEKINSKSINTKPKIISAVTKIGLRDDGIRSAQSSPFKTSSNVLQPMSYLTMNRRPSAGTIGVPVAALTQHRRSLQLNSSEGGFGIPKVNSICSFFKLKISKEFA